MLSSKTCFFLPEHSHSPSPLPRSRSRDMTPSQLAKAREYEQAVALTLEPDQLLRLAAPVPPPDDDVAYTSDAVMARSQARLNAAADAFNAFAPNFLLLPEMVKLRFADNIKLLYKMLRAAESAVNPDAKYVPPAHVPSGPKYDAWRASIVAAKKPDEIVDLLFLMHAAYESAC